MLHCCSSCQYRLEAITFSSPNVKIIVIVLMLSHQNIIIITVQRASIQHGLIGSFGASFLIAGCPS